MPFPLASGRYEVTPALRRFGQAAPGYPAESGHFAPDDRLAATLAAKLAVLRQAPEEAHLFAPGLSAAEADSLQAALQETFRLLAAEQPELATVSADGVTLHHLGLRLGGWDGPAPRLKAAGEPWPHLAAVAGEIGEYLGAQQGLRLLAGALGLAVQEDLAVVRGPQGEGGDVLEWLHVCLPSNWVPAEKTGRSFAAVHLSVVHSEQLVATGERIVRAMVGAGPFVRYVWGLDRDGALGHNPRLHQAPPWSESATPAELGRQAWFRVERQTTQGFPQLNRALFTIRYWVAPLTEVASDPWQRERLASALAGMDPDELRYKGLTTARDRLVAWLQAP